MKIYIVGFAVIQFANAISTDSFTGDVYAHIPQKNPELFEHLIVRNRFYILTSLTILLNTTLEFCPLNENRYRGIPYTSIIVSLDDGTDHLISILQSCGFLTFVRFLLISQSEAQDADVYSALKLSLYNADIYFIRADSLRIIQYNPPVNINAVFEDYGRKLCDISRVSCYPQSRLFCTIREKYNLTVAEVPKGAVFGKIANAVISLKTWQLLTISWDSYLQSNRYVEPHYTPYIRDTEDYYLLYCENGWRTQNEGFSHWTQAFAGLTWGMIGVTILTTAIIGWIRDYSSQGSLANQVFLVVAITLREPFSASNLKLTVLPTVVCFAFQFLSLRYESTLTTLFTIPAPPIIAPSFRHLIINEGFKMIYPVHNHSDLPYYDLNEFNISFSKSGISFNLEDHVQVFDPPPHDTKELSMANTSNRLATDIPDSERLSKLLFFGLESFKNGRFCHYLKEPFFQRVYSTKVTGKYHQSIVSFMGFLREIGLESYWFRTHKQLLTYKYITNLMPQPNAKELLEKYGKWNHFKPMVLSCKFIQIFIISGSLLATGMAALALEFVQFRLKKL